MKNFKTILRLLVLVGSTSFLYNCDGPEENGGWPNPYEDKSIAKNVEAYYDATLGYKASTDKVYDVYTEMSMDFGYMAYKMSYNQAFLKSTLGKMVTNGKIRHIKMEKTGLKPGAVTSTPAYVLSAICNTNSYRDEGVKIEDGFEEIIKNDRPALMITDFEQWDGEEDSKDFPLYGKRFKSWLEKPNHTITLYYADFCDAAQDAAGRKVARKNIIQDRHLKKIFFAYFDVDKDKSFSTLCAPDKSKRLAFQYECIDPAPYNLETNYKNLSTSGIGMGLGKQVTKVVQGLGKKKPFEFIYVSKFNWEFIDKTISKNKKKPFLEKLFLDASNDYAVVLNGLDVRVNDVTIDYQEFVKCNYAAELKPKIINDKNGNSVFSDKNNPVVKEAFTASTGELKEKFKFKKKLNYTEWKEIFSINNILFKNSSRKSHLKKINIETKIHPAFTLNKIKQRNGLIRVDIVAKVRSKGSSSFENLVWKSVGRGRKVPEYKNESLKLSVFEGINSVSKKDRIIYSYYIRVQPEK
jgi:hypothetical protein